MIKQVEILIKTLILENMPPIKRKKVAKCVSIVEK